MRYTRVIQFGHGTRANAYYILPVLPILAAFGLLLCFRFPAPQARHLLSLEIIICGLSSAHLPQDL